jgi:hypothetical protein
MIGGRKRQVDSRAQPMRFEIGKVDPALVGPGDLRGDGEAKPMSSLIDVA